MGRGYRRPLVPDATLPPVRTAVVGHVEWIEFGKVDHVPKAGEIVHATEGWEEPAGGRAPAAGQPHKPAGRGPLPPAPGRDAVGQRAPPGAAAPVAPLEAAP